MLLWGGEDGGIIMNQRTHSWIAIRAIAALKDEDRERNLVRLLKPHARKASVGAWIPDQAEAKRGGAGASTDNHILKMKPYKKGGKERFITNKKELLRRIGNHRATYSFLQEDKTLDPKWWGEPYKAEIPKKGKHLPNRAMALSTMMKDLLLLGDKRVDSLIPGKIRFAQYMIDETRTREQAAAMYFFMLSHFIADASVPCHCDARKLSSYSYGLHKELEEHWSRKIGTGFEKSKFVKKDEKLNRTQANADGNRVLKQARAIDDKFGLKFDGMAIPDLQPDQDVWLESIYQCRASFAVASIIAPPKEYPYGKSRKKAPFKTVFSGSKSNRQLLKDVNRIVMHDAVLNTAIVWKHIWNKVSK
jgi:hypothetical protein